MENFRSVPSRSNRRSEVSDNGQSQVSYTSQAKYDDQSLQTQGMTSEVPSSDVSDNRSFVGARKSNKNIRLIPLKVKDVIQLFQTNPEYRDKSPVKLTMNESSIDKIIQQQHGNNYQLTPPNSSSRRSPMSALRSSEIEYSRERLERAIEAQEPSKPPLGEAQNHQVFAMHDIQAYPMIGESGFRADTSPRRGRSKVRRVSPPRRHHSRPRKVVRYGRTARSPRRNRSRARPRNRTPRRHRSRPRKVVRVRPPKSVVAMPRPPLYDTCCTPFPMCENDCYPTKGNYYPSYPPNRYGPDVTQSRIDMACSCNLCQEKLQFIQPGVCPKKKYMWTNEYAIIPKPQVNLIDPCDELDPSIYPRADNPCIRDSHGNPLTDCIGRPLRDPVGKRFLRFGANGSVMNTNFRGNFYTGQPPLCAKCPMPDRSSCAPDTTHNYWMSCGYPIMPNMNPYFQQVVANENIRR